MPRRVLYICGGRSFHSSKPGRKIYSVVECWRKMGHEVVHVCGGDIVGDSSVPANDAVAKQYGALDFHRKWYRRIGVLDPLIRSVSEYRDIQHDAAMARHLEEVCRSFKPDLIWERSCRLHCAGLMAARRIGVPYVLEWKDNIASYWLSRYRNRARKMERYKNQEADFIVTESEVLRRDLIKDGIDAGKILVAQNAVDSGQFHRDDELRQMTRNHLEISKDTVLVGYLGSYAWYHDTCRLVKAMGILRDRGFANIRCLMVGAGKEYDSTRLYAEKHRLLDSLVIMKPGVPATEVPGILAALDIAVLPGSTEIICPIKIQEYMAAELPTLAPDYPCNREVIEDGRSGILFTPKSEEALADKILTLAQDHKRRLELGENARKEIVNSFSWEKTWGEALEKVITR